MSVRTIKSVDTLSELRLFNPGVDDTPAVTSWEGATVYVRCHSDFWDGGGGFFYYSIQLTAADDDGMIVASSVLNAPTGRWLRQIDDYISVRYYGTVGVVQPTDGDRIQAAIDYAASTVLNKTYAKGTVVYIPNGNYRIFRKLVLRDGVSIIGESFEKTVLTAGYPDTPGSTGMGATYDGNMMEMDPGRVIGCNVSNLTLDGSVDPDIISGFRPSVTDTKIKNAIHLKSVTVGSDGGLWNSVFKNIKIVHFNGSGLILEGSSTGYDRPNQFLVFENIQVDRQKDATNALLVQGQLGQTTFNNCRFDGFLFERATSGSVNKVCRNFNVVLENLNDIQPAVVSFIGCTFQNSEFGVFLKFAENVTFDTCWFETLSIGLRAVSKNGTDNPSRSINVLNNRFANAGGFGSLTARYANASAPYNFDVVPSAGFSLWPDNSQLNVFNNYVAVTDPAAINAGTLFIRADQGSGISTIGNSFQVPQLGQTTGVTQTFTPAYDGTAGKYYLNLKESKSVVVNGITGTTTYVRRMNCSANAGEVITIRAASFALRFENTQNIYLSGKANIVLNVGDIAVFSKMDIPSGTYPELYTLIGVLKNSTVV